jgi:4'-phosphopantetheinyl transferase
VVVHSSEASPVTVFTIGLTAADVGLLDLLDDRERQRFDRTVGEADRARFLLGAALLRTVAGSMLGIPAEAVTVDRACRDCGRWHGRPTLPGTGLEMSVSHSGEVVTLAALTGGGRVGVDVERTAGRPVPEVVAWTIAEATFKAGGGPDLRIHSLPAPAPGHVLTLATSEPAATIEVADATPLLTHPRATRGRVSSRWPLVAEGVPPEAAPSPTRIPARLFARWPIGSAPRGGRVRS